MHIVIVMGFCDLFFYHRQRIYKVYLTDLMVKMIKYICYTNASYTRSSFQYYILNIQMCFFSESNLEDHNIGKGDLQMYRLHDAFAVCICFISV